MKEQRKENRSRSETVQSIPLRQDSRRVIQTGLNLIVAFKLLTNPWYQSIASLLGLGIFRGPCNSCVCPIIACFAGRWFFNFPTNRAWIPWNQHASSNTTWISGYPKRRSDVWVCFYLAFRQGLAYFSSWSGLSCCCLSVLENLERLRRQDRVRLFLDLMERLLDRIWNWNCYTVNYIRGPFPVDYI